jgi:uracil-DNA glycosylase
MDRERREATIGTIPANWLDALGPAATPKALDPIATYVADRAKVTCVLPVDPGQVFAALRATPFDDVRAVILGQDPYPNREHAMGLAFSVPRDLRTPLPASLRRIRAELQSDCQMTLPDHGSLEAWTRRGVLLLNTSLTVDEGVSGSHRRAGWRDFTDAVITAIAGKTTPVAFLLWGRHAQAKEGLVTGRGHVVVPSPHPMARQRDGFRCSQPFSRANTELKRLGAKPIVWDLNDGEASE